MSFLKLFCLEILVLQYVSADCDSENGPAGSPECTFISNPHYDKYQWSTCVTNKYVQTASKGNFSCVEKDATYCYYQCMIEEYKVMSGAVNKDCQCNPNETLPINNLPSWCYSPSGDSCSWYSQCLEKKFPCQMMNQTSYAINNGVMFCQLYQDHFDWFSEDGQKWINGVRGCLQVSLVPLLRPFRKITCEKIKERAFNSHEDCYVNPNKGVPSYCFLPFRDQTAVLFTVGPKILSNCVFNVYHEACEDVYYSVVQLVNLYNSCMGRGYDSLIKAIQITFSDYVESSKRYRRTPSSTNGYTAVTNLVVTIEEKMRWKLLGVTWVGYFQNDMLKMPLGTMENKTIPRAFNILLAPSKLYNLNYKSNVTSDINMTEILNDVTSSFRNGSFTSDMINGISIEKFRVCGDNNCSKIIVEVDPLPTLVKKDKQYIFWTTTNIILVVVGSTLILLTSLSVVVCIQRKKFRSK